MRWPWWCAPIAWSTTSAATSPPTPPPPRFTKSASIISFARAKEMIEADFVKRGGGGVGGDVAADVVLHAIGAHHHGQRIPANQALDAAFEFLIAGEKRLQAVGNGVGVRRIGRKR